MNTFNLYDEYIVWSIFLNASFAKVYDGSSAYCNGRAEKVFLFYIEKMPWNCIFKCFLLHLLRNYMKVL